ncbi:hypothetical protein PI125_g2873 [Phytophthora idaei]|nr:hypothetical protein PI125_g2873 [Phytophthora idaei]
MLLKRYEDSNSFHKIRMGRIIPTASRFRWDTSLPI